jgi:hypothetical protein
MPIVELVAKRAIERNPEIGLSVTDMIVLLCSTPIPTRAREGSLAA